MRPCLTDFIGERGLFSFKNGLKKETFLEVNITHQRTNARYGNSIRKLAYERPLGRSDDEDRLHFISSDWKAIEAEIPAITAPTRLFWICKKPVFANETNEKLNHLLLKSI